MTVGAEEDIAKASTMMRKWGVWRLPVINGNGQIIGLLSGTDVQGIYWQEDGCFATDVILGSDRNRLNVIAQVRSPQEQKSSPNAL